MPFDHGDVIAAAFGIFNVLRLVSYLPQILAVARDNGSASAISISCWTIWIGANTSTALYAGLNVGDFALALISLFNAGCCAAVLVLALHKRLRARPGVDSLNQPETGPRGVLS
jgi:hypothetical protein